MTKIPRTIYQLTPEVGKIDIKGTLYNGDLKNLIRYTDSDANSEYIFWEASFDGSHTISNWKGKTTWNIIKAADVPLEVPDGVTYSIS